MPDVRSAIVLVGLALLASCGRPPAGSVPVPGTTPAQSSFLALDRDSAECRAVLDRLGTKASLMPGKQAPQGCGYAFGVMRTPAQGSPKWLGNPPVSSCAVAAALSWWEQSVVVPAARRHLGEPVVAIRHFGSYSCRTIGNVAGGQISEHGRANAIDIAGFRLASGREISVLKDWGGRPEDRVFLRTVRDGACDLFGTVLSPDYNAAHADHLHFDQANRRASFCR